jgi:hypothetical protein
MTQKSAIPEDVRVTVQARHAPNRKVGHRAVGLLGDSYLVCVPKPPASLVRPNEELEVVIFPIPLDDRKLVERFEILGVQTYGLTKEEPLVAILTLAGGSRYASQDHVFQRDDLTNALNNTNGDFKAALTAVGAVKPEVFTIADDDLLRLHHVEEEQRRPKFARYAAPLENVVPFVCWVLPGCTHK